MKAATTLKVTVDESGAWNMVGELTMRALSKTWSGLCNERPLRGKWVIDCKKVTKIDSAGVAYFIDALRFAKAHKLTLTIVHVPKTLHGLMSAQGLLPLFETVIKDLT